MTTEPAATTLIVCPHCTTSNRVPNGKLAAGGKCGRCGKALFAGEPVTLTGGTFDAHAVRAGIPLLVDFWAGWCGPCRMMAPAFSAAAASLEPLMRLGKLDTEAETALAGRYAIRSLPTMVLIYQGRELGRQSGAMTERGIVDWARSRLAGLHRPS